MLRITKQADYAIVLMGQFVTHNGPISYTAKDLSNSTGIPLPMVGKILKALVHGNLLTSQRGVKGGYSLARPPESISVDQIIAALDGPIALTACSIHDGDCQHETLCTTRTNWTRINAAILTTLRTMTLAEMVRPLVTIALPADMTASAGAGTRLSNGHAAEPAARPVPTKETV